jgi:hypothetical protein
MLISLFEDAIYALDVFSVVPVRFHLAETEDGGITGDMEVVPAEEVEVIGPVPRLSPRVNAPGLPGGSPGCGPLAW